ncbi:MAG: STAS domain-containing protein [Oscillospiraceae bacterium]|nr:STAS domain-containing protein [Oscillospiraceae bacterium]
MKITESRGSKGLVLYIAGKIDDMTSPQLQGEIFRALKLNKNLQLDFTDVESVNHAGVSVLQLGLKNAASKRGILEVLNANTAVKSELQNAGLGKLLSH